MNREPGLFDVLLHEAGLAAERGERRDPNAALVAVYLTLANFTRPPHVSRRDLQSSSYERLMDEWAVRDWVDAEFVMKYTGLPKSTTYDVLEAIVRGGLARTRDVKVRDRRGRRLPRRQYQIVPLDAPIVDPEHSRAWLVVEGRELPMVDEWSGFPASSLSGWSTVMPENAEDAAMRVADVILMYSLSRQAHSMGFVFGADMYERTLNVSREFAQAVDRVLDAFETGREVHFRSKGVRTPGGRKPFEVDVPVLHDPSRHQVELKGFERFWFREANGEDLFGESPDASP